MSIERLVRVLREVGFEIDPLDIADIIWLARYLPAPKDDLHAASEVTPAEPLTLGKSINPKNQTDEGAVPSSIPGDDPSKHSQPVDKTLASESSVKSTHVEKKETPALPNLYLRSKAIEQAGGLSFRSAGTSALPGKLAYSRALRPLLRGVPSQNHFTLDEDATVHRIADTQVWLPVMRPEQTRWLELDIVIDEWPSIVLWRDSIRELTTMLTNLGAFRSVQIWSLWTNSEKSNIELHSGWGSTARESATRPVGELNSIRGNRLVLVLSDCISPSWYDGTIGKILNQWGHTEIVILMQLLPDKFWPRTGLVNAISVLFRSSAPGKPNTQLEVIPASGSRKALPSTGFFPLPVLQFDHQLVAMWTQSITGKNNLWIPGVLLPLDNNKGLSRQQLIKKEQESASTTISSPADTEAKALSLVKRYRQNASPDAWKLAGYLSATSPLNLRVIQLIQRVMLPDAKLEHIAEFYLSGLIKRQKQEGITEDGTYFEFLPGVRSILQSSIERNEIIEVLQHTTQFINKETGQPMDFESSVAAPSLALETGFDVSPFAKVLPSVLRMLGGRYTRLADSLEGKTVFEERVVTEQPQEEWNAQEEAERLAAQKAEEERLAAQRHEEERLAKLKAEAEQAVRLEAERLAEEKRRADAAEERRKAGEETKAKRKAPNARTSRGLEKIGIYEIKSELGRSGMGIVYRGYDPRFEREVAIKVLPRELLHADPQFRRRFEREAKIIAQLEHSAIVPVYDVGEADGQPYFVMRFLQGGSLSDRIKAGVISINEAVRILNFIAPGLDEAHSKGIIHRDLKPSNILFDKRDNPYISDFGIAKLAQAQAASVSGSAIIGTPAYMAPEQAQGSEIDGRADIYALGIILYEMLTGRQPYEADTPMAVAIKHITDPVPHILQSNPKLPESIDDIIQKAMAKNKNDRFATGQEMVDALRSVQKVEPASASPGRIRTFFSNLLNRNPQNEEAERTVQEESERLAAQKTEEERFAKQKAEGERLVRAKRKTFISYSRANKEFAVRLARELKAEGFAVWIDQLDIPAGARWDTEIEKAIEEAEIFMILLAPNSVASEEVKDEIGYALDSGKRVLPILLEDCKLPLRLRRFQYVDFTNKNFEEGIVSLKEVLRSLTEDVKPKAKEDASRLAASKAEEEKLVTAERNRKAKVETVTKVNGHKYALIIANTEYIDPGLAQLGAPSQDAKEFVRVLDSPDICAFDDVIVLVNETAPRVSETIDNFFSTRKPDDLLVMYFSGHSVRDEYGSLYLALKNTNRMRLRSTAIKADFIREAMDQSRSKMQILILECRNSGFFAQGTKAEAGGSIETARSFQGTGYGRVILSASDTTQFAWEGNKVIGEAENSLFTHFLVKGLEGEADRNGDGRITVDELYEYVFEQVIRISPRQTPGKWSYGQQNEIVLRQNIRIEEPRPIPLPAQIMEEIEDARPYVREEAVQQLIKLLDGKNLGLARSAREALERISENDDSRRVRQAAAKALESVLPEGQEQTQASESNQSPFSKRMLQRDKEEQEARFKAEQNRLLQEKAELEKRLSEEQLLRQENKTTSASPGRIRSFFNTLLNRNPQKESDTAEVQIEIGATDATNEELDRMTRKLLSELRELNVESAELAKSESVPDRSKGDPSKLVSIALRLLPTSMPSVISLVQAWAARGQGRTIKFKGKGIEFEGTPEDLQKLLATLDQEKKKQ